jgi:hypothetical protein
MAAISKNPPPQPRSASAANRRALDEGTGRRAVDIAGSRDAVFRGRSTDPRLPLFDDAGESVPIFAFDAPLSTRVVPFDELDRIETTIPIGEREALFIDESRDEPLLVIGELVKDCSYLHPLVARRAARLLESTLVQSTADCKTQDQGGSGQEKFENHDPARVKRSGQSQAAH